MTAKMIVPNSVADSTARSFEENSESSEFRQFEFWVNGVKRILKIPMHSEVEPNSESSSKVINVEPSDVDEVLSCSFSADPIVIDPDLSDNPSCIPLSHEESVLTNFVPLAGVGHCQNDQSTVPQNNQSNASLNDRMTSFNPGSLSSANGSSRWKNRQSLTVRTELENKRLYHSPNLDVAAPNSQPLLRVPNSQPLLRGLLVPSIVSKNVSQPVEKTSNSKVPLILPELVKSSNSNTPLNLSDVGIRPLLQNSGIPVIMMNSASQPLVRNSNPVLPSSVSNSSMTYVLQPQWRLNTMTSANCSSSTGAVQSGLTQQAASQCSLMLMNKQSHDSVPPQTSCVQLRVADGLVNSSGADQRANLSQFVALNGQCYNPTTNSSSVPVCLDSSSAQVRRVKITTGANGSCIISVDGLTDGLPASSYTDKPTNSNTSNVLTTGSVLRCAVPYVLPNGTTFHIMQPNVRQMLRQTLRVMPSDTGTVHYMPSNALGNPRPVNLESLNILPNDKAFCLKPPNCQASSIPSLSFASQNVGLLGTSLPTQGRANGVQLVSGALRVGSVLASSMSPLPVGVPLYMSPSSTSVNVTGPPQPSVKCSSVACSASFSINSSAVLSKFSSSVHSSISSEPQSSGSLTPTCLPVVIPVTGVHTCRNALSIPHVKSTFDTTGVSYNKLNPQLREFENHYHAPFQPSVTEHSNVIKSGCSTSAVPEMSHNLVVMPSVTRILFNKYQATNPVAKVKSPVIAVSHGAASGITTPSVSGVKSVSSFLVSTASAWTTPTFPRWSCPTITKSRDSLIPCTASMLSNSESKAIVKCTWYPPKLFSHTSSVMADKPSNQNCVMTQNYSSTGNTVPLLVPTKVFPTLVPTVSCCPNDTNSHLICSVAQQPTQSLSPPQVTKSAFSFYNSRFKRPGCKSIQKLIPLSTNLPSNSSVNSAKFVTSVSQNILDERTDTSSLIPISVEFYDSSIVSCNVSKTRKHKSSSSRRRNGSYSTSTSSISDTINLLSEPESISLSESWTSDDSITIGKRQTRRRCRKLTKRKAYKNGEFSTDSLENSEANHKNVELQCFVSLENLYLNGKMSVDIRDSSENLVCCRRPIKRPMLTVNSLRENASRKKSYKLSTAVNYVSDTD